MIQERLRRRFYRRPEGLFADLRLLESNCTTYNPAGRFVIYTVGSPF
ncbi:unnamed protein product [Laminaria digitata]